ncbi:MAG: hypothetical protein AAGD00_00025 [Planctomycetota bacterium]
MPAAVTLRALTGTPLADPHVRSIVESTARAIAERTGVEVLELATQPDRVTALVDAPRLAAIGFAAELRRLTTQWYTRKYDAPTLWGEPASDDEPDWLSDLPWLRD